VDKSDSSQISVRWTGIIWQLIHLGIGGLLLIALWSVLGRFWSVEKFGQFNYIFAYISLAGIFIDFGLDVLLTRYIAHSNSNIPNHYWHFKLICSVVFSLLFFLLGLILTIPIDVLIWLLAGSLALSLSAFLNALIRARDKLDIEAKIGIIQKSSFILISIYGVVILQKQMLWVALCYAFSHIISLILTFVAIKIYQLDHSQYLEEKTESIRNLFFKALPLFLIALFSILTLRIDIFLLQALMDEQAVGIYTAALRLIEGIIVLGSAYQAAIFPKLVNQLNDHQSFKQLFHKAIQHLTMAGFIIALGGMLLGQWMIDLLYGEAFHESGIILISLLPVVILVYLNALFGGVIIAMTKQKNYLLILAIALFINIIADYLAISAFGTIGAVMGFWLKEITLLLLLISYIKNHYFIKKG